MGFYGDHIFPRVLNTFMDNAENRRLRTRVCGGLDGDVVEIGFGTGLNAPHLPTSVTRVRAVEPSKKCVELAQERIAESAVPIEIAGLDGQQLPFEDASADAVLSTWTLCTIPDVVAALKEIRRVLRPGGSLHFIEHGRSPDDGVRRWQDRLNGVQQRIACGCNINRDIPALIAEGGLTVDRMDTYYTKGEPKILGWTFEGTASVPA
jgi:ubiquinone/menaquinone biosynthesis C-methylase UbiE